MVIVAAISIGQKILTGHTFRMDNMPAKDRRKVKSQAVPIFLTDSQKKGEKHNGKSQRGL